MKAWEICKKENVGKIYKDNKSDREWQVAFFYSKCDIILKIKGSLITLGGCYTIQEIADMDFEELTDWSKVPVDTKILVRNYKENKWKKRYFAKYENGTVYAWYNGGTSYSQSDTIDWDCAKLYKGEKK